MNTIEDIFRRYQIHPMWWDEFRELVCYQVEPSTQLKIRLMNVVNYYNAWAAACLFERSQPGRPLSFTQSYQEPL